MAWLFRVAATPVLRSLNLRMCTGVVGLNISNVLRTTCNPGFTSNLARVCLNRYYPIENSRIAEPAQSLAVRFNAVTLHNSQSQSDVVAKLSSGTATLCSR
jgi:hypothetical protein